jgi:crotonobetainyl-CoA:carnitine CoA-transferase CaiB-like acyl-CoA transferase
MTAPTASSAQGPLAGYRVLELGSTVAGPFCGRLFADFGAEVIKVEAADGDPVRTMGSRYRDKSLWAASIFRNKSLIGVDLRKPRGQELIKTLVAKCDFLIENFRPGSLEAWGLGYEALAKINPGLIMVRISGYGQTGPYRERPGYGVICEAVSGIRHITGDPDRPPGRIATSTTDYITGLYAAFGAMVALQSRHQTGRGQVIDAALYEGAFSFMEPHVPAFEKLGIVAMRAGSRLPGNAPNNLYPTADEQYIHITAASDAVFRRIAKAIGEPALASDARFATALARVEHEDAIDDIITRWTLTHTCAQAEEKLHAGRGSRRAHLYDGRYFRRPALRGARHAHQGSRRRSGLSDDARRGAAAIGDAGCDSPQRPPRRSGHAQSVDGTCGNVEG